MRKVLVAIIARNGAIGLSTMPCTLCCDSSGTYVGLVAENMTTGGKCRMCEDRCYVPANERPWAGHYLGHSQRLFVMVRGHSVICGSNSAASWRSYDVSTVVVTKNTVRASPYYSGDRGYARSLRGAIGLIESRREGETGAAYAYRMTEGKIFFAGGAKLFAEGLSLADELELTLIDRDWKGDVRFPGWSHVGPSAELLRIAENSLPGWECIDADRRPDIQDLVFTSWRRK